MKTFAFIWLEGNECKSWRSSYGGMKRGVELKLDCNLQSISASIEGSLPKNTASWQVLFRGGPSVANNLNCAMTR